MLRLWAVAVFSLTCLLASSKAPSAQELDRQCQKIVDALCEGRPLGACFRRDTMWAYISPRCTADVQTMIEMEREARAEQPRRRAREAVSFSCGGILRSRPSMSSGRVASIPAGQELESVEDTGVWHDGYKWFRVRYQGMEGYQWGGIFWTQGGREGTIPSCDG